MKFDGIRFARWSGNLVKLDDEIVIEATGNMSMPAEPSPPTIWYPPAIARAKAKRVLARGDNLHNHRSFRKFYRDIEWHDLSAVWSSSASLTSSQTSARPAEPAY